MRARLAAPVLHGSEDTEKWAKVIRATHIKAQ
jgi:hypothetical protein